MPGLATCLVDWIGRLQGGETIKINSMVRKHEVLLRLVRLAYLDFCRVAWLGLLKAAMIQSSTLCRVGRRLRRLWRRLALPSATLQSIRDFLCEGLVSGLTLVTYTGSVVRKARKPWRFFFLLAARTLWPL